MRKNPPMTSHSEILKEYGINILGQQQIKNLSDDLKTLLVDYGFIRERDSEDFIYIWGNGGSTFWRKFNGKLTKVDFFDRETFRILRKLKIKKRSERFSLVFPKEFPIFPVQKLAEELNISRPSQMGIGINDNFGLWYGIRAIFISNINLEYAPCFPFYSPCENCLEKPCLRKCPVSAIKENAPFHLSNCMNHRMTQGSSCTYQCASRNACSFKSTHRYNQNQQIYHGTKSLLIVKNYGNGRNNS